MERLGLDYLGRFVIHRHYHNCFGAWRAMEELYEAGRVCTIGVDHFTQDWFADVLFWNGGKLAVNAHVR